jgi:hypothetical protein
MSQKPDQPSSAGGVQVFELTMDNPEDQDELNRRLRKPSESESGASPKDGRADQAEPIYGLRCQEAWRKRGDPGGLVVRFEESRTW